MAVLQNKIDTKKRRANFVKAVSEIEKGEIDTEQVREDVMQKQAESLLKSMYFLKSGIYENYLERLISKEDDVVLKLAEDIDLSENKMKKLRKDFKTQKYDVEKTFKLYEDEMKSQSSKEQAKDMDDEKKIKYIHGIIKRLNKIKMLEDINDRVKKEIELGEINVNKFLDDIDIDAESLGVSKYLWGTLLPEMLKETQIPPFEMLKELININSTNLLIYNRFGQKGSDDAQNEDLKKQLIAHIQNVCTYEIKDIDAKTSTENARNDASVLSEIIEYAKDGYIDYEELRKIVLARKLSQLEILTKAFMDKDTETNWAELMIAPENGKEIEPASKLKILVENMLELPKAIATVKKSDALIVKDAIRNSSEAYKYIINAKMGTQVAKKEAEYMLEILSKLGNNEISIDEFKKLVQSQKAEKLYSISRYIFEKSELSQYLPVHGPEIVDTVYLDKDEIFFKMLSNIKEALILLNENMRTKDIIGSVINSVYNQKLALLQGQQLNGNNENIHELRKLKKEKIDIENAKNAIMNIWNIKESKTRNWGKTKINYSVEQHRRHNPQKDITSEILRSYILSRKAEDIESLLGDISRKNARIEEVLTAIDGSGYYNPLIDKYLSDIKKLKNSEQIDIPLLDIINRIEQDEYFAKNDIIYNNLKQLASTSAEERKDLLDSIINYAEQLLYGTVSVSFFKQIENLKNVSDKDEFEETVYGLLAELEETSPELIDELPYIELKSLASDSSELIKHENEDTQITEKITGIIDKYKDTDSSSITQEKKEILDALYSRIKKFELQDKKTANKELKKNIPELNGIFLINAKKVAKEEISKLLSYACAPEADIIYAAKKLCDNRLDFLNEKINILESEIIPRAEELLIKAAGYITETPDYINILHKTYNGAKPKEDSHEDITSAAYNFARDYEIYRIKMDFFTEGKDTDNFIEKKNENKMPVVQ